MFSLHIKHLPEALYEALKEAAQQERRSLNQQAIIVLERGLYTTDDSILRRRKLFALIDEEAPQWEHLTDTDVNDWLREDRDR